MNTHLTGTVQKDRKSWMALLSMADVNDLEAAWKLIPDIAWDYIIKPETGMLMVQARQDGDKSSFNLGEVTVSRCMIRINDHYTGAGWVMGSSSRHAYLAAIFDGLLQDPDFSPRITEMLIPVLEQKQKDRDSRLHADATDTRVAFFTLKRGE